RAGTAFLATATATALALALAGGCGKGDYSNEDLEFFSVLPERGDIIADIPSSSASAPADQAELYVATRKAINDFNGLVDEFLGLIDAVRSNRPTVRLSD